LGKKKREKLNKIFGEKRSDSFLLVQVDKKDSMKLVIMMDDEFFEFFLRE